MSRAADVPLLRNQLLGGLFLLGCANGVIVQLAQSIEAHGLLGAFFNTFDISLIVLFACATGIMLITNDRHEVIQRSDIAVAIAIILLIAVPIVSLSWLAVTALSIYTLARTTADSAARRGATILLAVTLPMLWTRLVFNLFTKYILQIDAWLVSWVMGTSRTGNMVEFADHSANLAIWPACSSLANVSLALLFWVTVTQIAKHDWRPMDLLWSALICGSVIAVNVVRISLTGQNLSYYHMLHSPAGDAVAGSIMLFLTAVISLLGVRREAFASS